MAILKGLTDGDIEAVANDVLGPAMSELGFTGVEVENRDVFLGEGPSLFIGAKVAEDVPAPFDANRLHRLQRLLHDALLDRGEDRFPHFSLKRAGDELPDLYYPPIDP